MSQSGLRGSPEEPQRRLLVGRRNRSPETTAAPTPLDNKNYTRNSVVDGDKNEGGGSIQDPNIFSVLLGLFFLALVLRIARASIEDRRRGTLPSRAMNSDATLTVATTKTNDMRRNKIIARSLVTKTWVPTPSAGKDDSDRNKSDTDICGNQKNTSDTTPPMESMGSFLPERMSRQDEEVDDDKSKAVVEEYHSGIRCPTPISATEAVTDSGGSLDSPVCEMTSTASAFTITAVARTPTKAAPCDSVISDDDLSADDDSALPGCAICLQIFFAGDLVCQSNNGLCTHVFHRNCMVHWLRKHDECPNCRRLYLLELATTIPTQSGAATIRTPTEIAHS